MSESQPRRRAARPAPRPGLAPDDPLRAFGERLRKIEGLDDLARTYPGREITVGRQRQQLEFFSTPERPNAFAMVALEFFLVIAQYYREALPLRLILLLIAGQRAGGRIPLTQDDMAQILDVPRQKVNQSLREVMSHGIVIKRSKGVYQFNPPYSYVAAELVRLSDGSTEYVQVGQADALAELRAAALPDLVRFPSLEHMREAIEEFREERTRKRRERRERFGTTKAQKEGDR
ncbi:hypothetical protein [Streptomyces alfalfae]|uniref:hypothetical protein n=1 Tax=Streptomyces alfalfae TaxID=1642299 RepID=UPI00281142F9|nr:hypothetical protein [Streptomyces alfalfae]